MFEYIICGVLIVSACVCECLCVSVFVCMTVYVVSLSVRACARAFVFVRACVCVCACVRVCVCVLSWRVLSSFLFVVCVLAESVVIELVHNISVRVIMHFPENIEFWK
jgi:hypothetical protein